MEKRWKIKIESRDEKLVLKCKTQWKLIWNIDLEKY